ncbi:MAG: hypothetical protein ACRDOA_21635 [Streptosporangiaceae bacterium]
MIDMQLIGGVLTALAVLVGVSIAISLAMWAASSVAQTGQTPPGGIRRDPPRQPLPEPDDARELVLV